MKKGLFLLSLIVTFYALGTVSASAVTNDTVKVGLRYGSSVMSSANLENDEGSGYEFGYFEDDRTFVSLGETDETAITMEPAGRDGIQVTITGTDRVLYESREDTLAVMPQGRDPVTWFRGNRYRGGFEYTVSGGGLQVVNVVDLEDYVKGVLPSEMPGNWELEALKAQAVCARTFACLTTKHLSAYGFDVCSSTDCQAYSGIGEATSATDRAVEETAGGCLYYDGELAQAYYHSSDGGATEDAENVWGTDVPFLRGKEDPYEAQISIPDYRWTVTYTWEELTWVLQNSGYDIGDVVDAYVSEVTDLGNVYSVTFVDSRGKTTVLNPGSHFISVKNGSLYADQKKLEGSQVSLVAADARNPVLVHQKKYRGALTVLLNSGKKNLNVVNTLPLEQYLYGVVAKEVLPLWPDEAIKAQAVAARSFALYSLEHGKYPNFDIRSNELGQVYGGLSAEHANTSRLVDATSGVANF